jgi:hypothetical protein
MTTPDSAIALAPNTVRARSVGERGISDPLGDKEARLTFLANG